ncbi:MAG: hypothetical protein A2293_12135 [Elusimicrobia bacterium RIFOXYB2_FULL_49_7]|nr:MAG: hypothetical protein A2293_12135 [Elusimicrobia bacterium RIFOXYB2_FULL_49_7]
MKKYAMLSSLLLVGLFVFSGCNKNATKVEDDPDALDGTAALMASEVSAMDAAAFDFSNIGASTAKAYSGQSIPDTVNMDVIILPWQQQNTYCWVRRAQVTYASGARERIDSVWFFDANGQLIEGRPSLAEVDSIVHHRNMIRIRQGHEANIRLAMTLKLHKTELDTYCIKNGTIVGTCAGVEFKNAAVTNVIRYREEGFWLFPEAGKIYIDKILRTISIQFQPNGQAIATVTRKRDGKTTHIQINISTGAEVQQ